VDEAAAADVDPDVARVGEEDEVTRAEVPAPDLTAAPEVGEARVRQGDAEVSVDEADEPGAVEPGPGRRASPAVADAEEVPCVRDDAVPEFPARLGSRVTVTVPVPSVRPRNVRVMRASPGRRTAGASLQRAQEREHERDGNGEQQYEEANRPQEKGRLPSMGAAVGVWRPLAVGVDGQFSTSEGGWYHPTGGGTATSGKLTQVRRKVLTALLARSQRGHTLGRLDGDMPEETRVEAGRRRARAAKRAVALTAAAGFAVAVGLVRQGHPATGTSSTRTVPQSTGSSSSSSLGRQSGSQLDGTQLGGGSIAPSSGGSPSASTHTS
jgi:hypothetical protein